MRSTVPTKSCAYRVSLLIYFLHASAQIGTLYAVFWKTNMSTPCPRSLPHPKPSASVSEKMQYEYLCQCGISEDISFRCIRTTLFAALLQINDGYSKLSLPSSVFVMIIGCQTFPPRKSKLYACISLFSLSLMHMPDAGTPEPFSFYLCFHIVSPHLLTHSVQNDARETAGRRVESAREASRRRADGDLKDAAERLDEERQRFKAQLGAAHAEILRLGAEAAESERRRNSDKERPIRQASAARLSSTGEHGGVGDNGPSGEGSIIVDDGGVGRRTAGGGGGGVVILEERTGVPTGGRKRPAEGNGREGGGAGEEEIERERALRREVEGEREALRRMCNGLAVDLKGAVEARSEAKDEREALVQVVAVGVAIVSCGGGKLVGRGLDVVSFL